MIGPVREAVTGQEVQKRPLDDGVVGMPRIEDGFRDLRSIVSGETPCRLSR